MIAINEVISEALHLSFLVIPHLLRHSRAGENLVMVERCKIPAFAGMTTPQVLTGHMGNTLVGSDDRFQGILQA